MPGSRPEASSARFTARNDDERETNMTRNDEPTMAEVMAVLLARDIADGEKAIIGTNSDIQLAACNLARLMQAPRLWWISGPGGMVNPNRDHLLSTADFENLESAEAWMDLPNMI